jgi:hypothetical protein
VIVDDQDGLVGGGVSVDAGVQLCLVEVHHVVHAVHAGSTQRITLTITTEKVLYSIFFKDCHFKPQTEKIKFCSQIDVIFSF